MSQFEWECKFRAAIDPIPGVRRVYHNDEYGSDDEMVIVVEASCSYSDHADEYLIRKRFDEVNRYCPYSCRLDIEWE